ncbi:MAG: hypothetical protein KatS3mg022_3051 [Armatimonadota bacterium]|nr:MAG: hypothetical protein KatS3mg022_3051 [Armatimonadota bacterium]GIV18251.1 MAG: hypothetical protein KatS3mg023_0002 [Armatimonadota bacterium]GIV22195.1 MAG: hypothetical protein KatS3mg023_3946 [Armatimonadota bacterium]
MKENKRAEDQPELMPLERGEHVMLLEVEGRYHEALELCRRYLSEPERLTEQERQILEDRYAVLSRFTDPNYSPPAHLPSEEYEPLHLLMWDALRRGDYEQALLKAWDYMQYLSAGSYPLQLALGELADCALKAGEEQLAKAAAHLFVAHLRFLEVASRNPKTPISPRIPREKWKPVEKPIAEIVFAIPEETAFRFILEEDHPDWATILEMRADIDADFPFHPSPRFLRVVEALVRHYQKFGKREALQALLQRHPEARRFVQGEQE